MKYILMNMVRIFKDNEVVVLDKKKKYGWEGLTFPGGKVEAFESFNDAAIREVKEETNLDIKDLEFNGIIQWINLDDNITEVGLLYSSYDFTGKLISENREGTLFFKDYNEFKTMDNHSDSMEYIFKIYDNECFEIVNEYKDGKLINSTEKYNRNNKFQ